MDKQKLKGVANYLGSQGFYKEAAQIIKVAQLLKNKTLEDICNEINNDIRYGNILRARVGKEENLLSADKNYIIIGFEPEARETMSMSERNKTGEQAIRDHLSNSKYVNVLSRGTVTAVEDRDPAKRDPLSVNIIDTVPPSKEDRFNTGTTKVFYYELVEETQE